MKIKVYHDGSHYVGKLPMFGRKFHKKHMDEQTQRRKAFFEKALKEAKRENIPNKELLEHIQIRAMNELDVSDWFTDEEVKELLKSSQTNFYKRRARLRKKLFLNEWNYFVTFTYDDKKETDEGFVKRLRKALSNLSTRNGWRYIGVRERGSNSGRIHYHFIMYIPEGQMIGKLFEDRVHSAKRNQWETFVNNSYFQDRFGQSHWQAIDGDNCKVRLLNYLLKYISKDQGRVIYSRHVATELTLDVDFDKTPCFVYKDNGYKVIVDNIIEPELITDADLD